MRGYQKVPYPLDTPEWESFLKFAEKHYNEAVRIAVNVTLANCGAGSTTTQLGQVVLRELLNKTCSPLVYLWEQWQLLTPSARLPYATKEYREILEKQIEEAKQIAKQVTSQIGTVKAPPQEKKEAFEE
ncbi:MAG: hypothetical protein DRJ18_00120 [Candidatus Methanomethylicota archaeon]|nr:MAG: hypothetical protein DRJ18_00120 [Candidatus Verstraetearchaeota archaeon]